MPLEQAALAFIPAATNRGQGRETVSLLLGLAVAVGIVTSLFTAGLPTLLPQLFTNDAALFPIMRSVAPQASCTFSCFPYTVVESNSTCRQGRLSFTSECLICMPKWLLTFSAAFFGNNFPQGG